MKVGQLGTRGPGEGGDMNDADGDGEGDGDNAADGTDA
jgi:hypothetical protein